MGVVPVIKSIRTLDADDDADGDTKNVLISVDTFRQTSREPRSSEAPTASMMCTPSQVQSASGWRGPGNVLHPDQVIHHVALAR